MTPPSRFARAFLSSPGSRRASWHPQRRSWRAISRSRATSRWPRDSERCSENPLRGDNRASVNVPGPGNQTSSVPRELPRGPHRLRREVVEASQRERMLDAIVQAVADKGYSGTTVGDVVSRAGVSRKTFYEHFADKEDCFLAACTYVADTLYDAVARTIDAARTPSERLELLVRTYLRSLRASPRGAIAFIIEAR